MQFHGEGLNGQRRITLCSNRTYFCSREVDQGRRREVPTAKFHNAVEVEELRAAGTGFRGASLGEFCISKQKAAPSADAFVLYFALILGHATTYQPSLRPTARQLSAPSVVVKGKSRCASEPTGFCKSL